MKLTKAQKRLLDWLEEKDDWVVSFPAQQKTMNVLVNAGLVYVNTVPCLRGIDYEYRFVTNALKLGLE